MVNLNEIDRYCMWQIKLMSKLERNFKKIYQFFSGSWSHEKHTFREKKTRTFYDLPFWMTWIKASLKICQTVQSPRPLIQVGISKNNQILKSFLHWQVLKINSNHLISILDAISLNSILILLQLYFLPLECNMSVFILFFLNIVTCALYLAASPHR